nr:hypothetical protein KXZ65_00490 [Pectobacterium sp. PL152]
MDDIENGQVTSREEKEWQRGREGGNTRMKILLKIKRKQRGQARTENDRLQHAIAHLTRFIPS